MNEQRQHPRLGRIIDILVGFLGEDGQPDPSSEMECILTNVSESGLSFLSRKELQNGERIWVDLNLYPEDPDAATFRAIAEVKWYADESGEPYAVGAMFLEMDAAADKALREFLDSHPPEEFEGSQ